MSTKITIIFENRMSDIPDSIPRSITVLSGDGTTKTLTLEDDAPDADGLATRAFTQLANEVLETEARQQASHALEQRARELEAKGLDAARTPASVAQITEARARLQDRTWWQGVTGLLDVSIAAAFRGVTEGTIQK